MIVDKLGNILSTGMNGLSPGAKCETVCVEGCMASHSEISALVRLERVVDACTMYVTCEPCMDCTKAILLTNIRRVVYKESHRKTGKSIFPFKWEKFPF